MRERSEPWLLFQIADSAFPTGGFAHSLGLEAACQLGEVRTAEELDRFVDAALWQTGLGALPFVGAAHDRPCDIEALDRASDARLTSHVSNRASRTQGRTFASTCAKVWEKTALAELDEACRERRIHAHVAPVFGAALHALDLPRSEVLALYLQATLRALASAAVRLGLAGPHEAQRLVAARGPLLNRVLGACEHLGPDDATQSAPLLELFGATQDRLYSRLFQS